MGNNRKAFLEITNRCNLSCVFCPGCSRPAHRLTEEEFRFLADRLRPWADYLYFHLMGEPLSHPLLPAFIRYAGERGFRPMLTTNGTLLNVRGGELLAEGHRPYKISVSLHAFEANDLAVPFEEYLDACLSFADRAA